MLDQDALQVAYAAAPADKRDMNLIATVIRAYVEASTANTSAGRAPPNHRGDSAMEDDDYFEPDYDDDDMDDECGLMTDGQCMLAGTEHCDWDCGRLSAARIEAMAER